MVRKPNEFPSQGEKVIGTVKRLNPYSAFVELDEYEGLEGMIHISEASRKWVKDIREIVKEGQKVVALVMRVDPEKGHIALSLKRLGRRDYDEKMKEFKREQKAEKMLELVGKELGLNIDQAYEEVGFPLMDIFGEMFKGFQTALTNPDILGKKGIPEKYVKVIKAVAEKVMELKEIEIRGMLELRSYAPDGVERIKNILAEAAKKMEVKYISAPKYLISIKSKDIKTAEKKLETMADEIIRQVEKADGEGKFEKIKE
ncbi:translation initiation factor IF-2 subunit alpha [archaeon]|nr:MAG: translation initiation factor IF-2 subunit alpha [archaeon]